MKYKLTVVFVLAFFLSRSQQASPGYIHQLYRPLILALQEPDSLFVYSVHSNWGSGVDIFICFKNSGVSGGYFIGNDAAFNALAGRSLIEEDSFQLVTRTVIDSALSVSEIIRFISGNSLFTLLDEDDLKLNCPNVVYHNDTLLLSKPVIDDGSYYRLLKISERQIQAKEYYEIYEMNKWCPSQKEYALWVQLDRLFTKTFPSRDQVRKNFIEEYRQRKAAKTHTL